MATKKKKCTCNNPKNNWHFTKNDTRVVVVVLVILSGTICAIKGIDNAFFWSLLVAVGTGQLVPGSATK